MKKINLSLVFFVAILVSSFSVCASDNAPPAIPSEYWGSVTMNGVLAANGLIVEALVNGINYAQPSQTLNGYYNIILIGGDRELTYEGDPTCAVHWGAGQACVPCDLGIPGDCVEGPQDGADIMVKINNIGNMPWLDWEAGSSKQEDIVNPIGDWNKLGCVDMTDFTYFANHYGETPASPNWVSMYDVYKDDTIDMTDFTVFANHYNEGDCS